jgi:branched-chain amino acid transport system permease protein
MIGAYLASTFFLSTSCLSRSPWRSPSRDRPRRRGHRAGAAAVGEQGLRPHAIGTIGFGIVLEALAIIIWGPRAGRALAGARRAARCVGHPHPHVRPAGHRHRREGRHALADGVFLQRPSCAPAMQAVAMDHEAGHPLWASRRRALASRMAFVNRRRPAALKPVDSRPDAPTSARSMGGPGHQGLRGGDPRRLRLHPRRHHSGPGHRGVLDSYAAGHIQGTRNWCCSWVHSRLIIMIRPTGNLGETTVNRA